jgi:hypothetical protein
VARQPAPPEREAAAGEKGDIDALRQQLDEVQKRLDKLSGRNG